MGRRERRRRVFRGGDVQVKGSKGLNLICAEGRENVKFQDSRTAGCGSRRQVTARKVSKESVELGGEQGLGVPTCGDASVPELTQGTQLLTWVPQGPAAVRGAALHGCLLGERGPRAPGMSWGAAATGATLKPEVFSK